MCEASVEHHQSTEREYWSHPPSVIDVKRKARNEDFVMWIRARRGVKTGTHR